MAGRPVLSDDGSTGRLMKLVARTALLNALTLSVHRFWGKTRIRRYLWSHISLFGDRLEYTGTGRELFLGFLIALGMAIPLVALVAAYQLFLRAEFEGYGFLIKTATYVLVCFLTAVAYYRARGYKMACTRWRGIRFGQSGSANRYAAQVLGRGFLALITLGIMRPHFACATHGYAVDNTWFGNARFGFNGRPGDLMGAWLACYVLAPFSAGLSLLWYSAYQTRYFTSKTHLGALSFGFPVTFWDYAKIYLPFFGVMSALILIFATISPIFGGAYQFIGLVVFAMLAWSPLKLVMVTHRLIGLFARRMRAQGAIDFDSIVQRTPNNPFTGEGMANTLDFGAGLEVGL